MFLYLNKDKRITAYDDSSTREQMKEEIKKEMGVWYDGDFDFFMGEDKPGMQKDFYLNEDNTIRR